MLAMTVPELEDTCNGLELTASRCDDAYEDEPEDDALDLARLADIWGGIMPIWPERYITRLVNETASTKVIV